MCSINQGFKLCSCKGKPDKNKPYWKLSRKDPNREILLLVGESMSPYNQPPKRKTIANELNKGVAFDFDFVPREYDLLEFFAVTYRHKYQFLQGQWKFVSAPMMGVPTIEHGTGRIK